jgi:glycosyltransferase involved in cell wall biosynthesis
VTIHDASLFLHRQYHPWQRVVALRLMMPHIARRAAKIITVSHHARRELQRVLKLPAEKFEVIYQGVGRHFRPIAHPQSVAAIRQQYSLPNQYILYVGTLEPRKNLRRLLAAFAQLKRCPDYRHTKLVIVGANGWHMSEFEQQLDALQLRRCVVRLGYVPENDLPAIYSQATCLAFPSLHEGFGIPPLEALACGTPVVTSRESAMSEICAAAAVYVDPTDTASISAGLHTLLSNPQRQAELRAAGFVRVRDFTWQSTARKTAQLYAEVLR